MGEIKACKKDEDTRVNKNFTRKESASNMMMVIFSGCRYL
jgi:hypothetical protein